MNKIRIIGLIGGILAVLVALWAFFLSLVFSDVLRGFGAYVNAPNYPLPQSTAELMFIESLIVGAVGLTSAALGIVGSIIRKKRGGIFMIVAGVVSAVISPILGLLPLILLTIAGAMALTEKPN
jgi:hypothetical protein